MKYKKVYLKGMEFDQTDFIPCEVCGTKAVDIHHIDAKGMGGRKNMDFFENLIALCRECHVKYGDKKQWKKFLNNIVKNRKK